MRKKLHQYNLKHPGDKEKNSFTQNRSRISPKQADLPKGKVNFASPTGLDTSSTTEDNVELIEKYEEPVYVEDFLYDNPPEEYDNMLDDNPCIASNSATDLHQIKINKNFIEKIIEDTNEITDLPNPNYIHQPIFRMVNMQVYEKDSEDNPNDFSLSTNLPSPTFRVSINKEAI